MIIVPHSTMHASARSRALTEALQATIADFQKSEPKLTDGEIEAALALAHASTHSVDARQRRALIGVLAGIAAVLGAVVILMAQSNPSPDYRVHALVAAGVAVVVAVVGLVIRFKNNP